MCAIVQFHSKPIAIICLRSLVRRTAAAKRIKNQISRICGDANRSLGDHKLQLVNTGPDFEFLMAIWRCVIPKISEIEALRVQLVPMPPVILDLSSAMTAFLNR